MAESEGNSFSLVNAGNLSKPADTLIKKISNAVGGICAPWQIKRIAKAEAEAALIKAEGAIQVTDLQRRAMHRFIEEESKYQQNMEEITAKAVPLLTDAAKPDAMEDDWITNFFDKSRIISSAEMQTLWSKVLAGEANAPGTFSKRTVNLLGDMDKSDAALFTTLCGFGWFFSNVAPLIFDSQAEIYTKQKRFFQNPGMLGNFSALFERQGVWRVCLSWLTSRRFSTICNASFFPRSRPNSAR
jgi:hypothetical protein